MPNHVSNDDGKILPAKVRDYVYGLLSPIALILIYLGVTTETEASLWLGLAGAILQTGSSALTIANRPGKGS